MAEIFGLAASAVTLAGFAVDFYRTNLRGQRKSGLIVCHSPSPAPPEVDIIFIHGLGTGGKAAWSDIDSSTGRTICWPQSELPKHVSARARIAIYNYDAKFRTPEYLTRRTLLHQTSRLVDDLVLLRQGKEQPPIIFVCHSLGGLVVKNALVGARRSEDPQVLGIYTAISGIIFLGTPHEGSPSALADSICRIVEPPSDEINKELHERSRTLAYTLERFKPLATHLTIYAFLESGPGVQSRYVSSGRHFQTINRSHSDLCKFSNPEDKDLRVIMDAINNLCVRASDKNRIEVGPTANVARGLHDRQHGGYVSRQVSCLGAGTVHWDLLGEPAPPQLSELNTFFGRWLTKEESSPFKETPQSAWPVALIRDPSGTRKTQLALQYARQYRHRYGSLIWINASTRKSIELGFRDVARRINSGPARQVPTFKINIPDGDRDLSDDELGTLVQRVREWMEQPQQEKWLLVVDNLSPKSPFPFQPGWTSRPRRPYTWRELLRLVPSVAGWFGHVIICTRDSGIVSGLKIVSFKSSTPRVGTKGVSSSVSPVSKFQQRFTGTPSDSTPEWFVATWWCDLSRDRQLRFALALLMTDKECSRVPLTLLQHENDDDGSSVRDEVNGWPIRDVIVSKEDCGDVVILPSNILEAGLQMFFHRASDIFVNIMDELFEPIYGWDTEAQLVRNLSAMLRRWDQLDNDSIALNNRRIKIPGGICWDSLARVCEQHKAYSSSSTLYELEQQNHSPESREGFELRLHATRVRHLAKKDEGTRDAYQRAFSDSSVPFDLRLVGFRGFASLSAEKGQFEEAVDQLSEALASEDPFGSNSNGQHINEAISDLASYLAITGNRSSASSLLQRLILSLEDARGGDDPSTLSAMGALSILKQEEGKLDEAISPARAVHQCQESRLGSDHPSTVLSWCRVAAVLDLQGHQRSAELIYRQCLERAIPRLGLSHPSVFGIRENLARCLLAQGKTAPARDEHEKLRDEIDKYPGLYSDAVERRVHHFLRGTGTVDDYELDLHLSKRNTIGIWDLGDLGLEEADDSEDELPEYWDESSDDESEVFEGCEEPRSYLGDKITR
ncbi:hypothetical protein OQA88_11666 [Cercophora sp. LCS_1]